MDRAHCCRLLAARYPNRDCLRTPNQGRTLWVLLRGLIERRLAVQIVGCIGYGVCQKGVPVDRIVALLPCRCWYQLHQKCQKMDSSTSKQGDTLLTPLGTPSSWLLWGRSRSASFLRSDQNIGRRAACRACAVRMFPLMVGLFLRLRGFQSVNLPGFQSRSQRTRTLI